MSGRIKAVIFDIDNTLYDFAQANRTALDALRRYSLEHFGWDYEEFDARHDAVQKEIYSYMGYNGSCRCRILRYQKMLEYAGLPLSPHAVAMYDLYWKTLLDGITPFEGAENTLRALRERKIRIGAGTDMTAYMQFRKLEKLGLLQYIDFLVSSEEAGEEKPSRALFRLCVQKARCLPEECLFVGDHLKKDYEGALSFGMNALWYHPRSSSPVDVLRVQNPQAVSEISRLDQVLERIS